MNEVLKKLLLVLVVTPFFLSVFSKTFAFDENKNIQESQVLVTANSLDVTQDDIEKIKNAAMKATNHISQVLGIEKKREIEIIIAGAYSINLPKTSGGVIYIPATYKNNLMSIFHEIYHAIALRHSRKKFFSEGMATFFQFELTNNTAFLHSYVANNEDSIIPLIRLKTYQDVFQPTPQHDKDKRTFAYSMAGSFFSFLAENYGYQKLQDLYNTATLNYKKVYGKKIKELEVEWKAYIFGELPPQDYPKNADAQFELGQKYHLWKYKSRNITKAKQYYKLAAEQGHLDAQYNLGLLLKDVKGAVYWFSLAAEKGHLDAQKKLGSMYYEGREVPHNYNEAIKWYTMAAYQSDINAQRKLGLCYIEADADYVKAYAWLTMAAEQGSNMSRKKRDQISKEMTSEQIAAANELIKERKGDAEDQFKMGDKYYKESFNSSLYRSSRQQSVREAIKWFRKAAGQGHPEAQYILGSLRERGHSFLHEVIPQDYKKAKEWYRLAANQGNIKAQRRLGEMYMEGIGVTPNYNEAIKWFNLAAFQDDIIAQRKLGLCYIELGEDFTRAYAWLTMAANKGSQVSKKKRDEISSKMTPEQIVSANELIKELKAR